MKELIEKILNRVNKFYCPECQGKYGIDWSCTKPDNHTVKAIELTIQECEKEKFKCHSYCEKVFIPQLKEEIRKECEKGLKGTDVWLGGEKFERNRIREEVKKRIKVVKSCCPELNCDENDPRTLCHCCLMVRELEDVLKIIGGKK